jgi:hypothetical protein
LGNFFVVKNRPTLRFFAQMAKFFPIWSHWLPMKDWLSSKVFWVWDPTIGDGIISSLDNGMLKKSNCVVPKRHTSAPLARCVATCGLKKIFCGRCLYFSFFNTQTMHIKSFYTQQQCYVSLKTLYPGGIRTRVFLFLRQIRCPLRHAARAHMRDCCLYSVYVFRDSAIYVLYNMICLNMVFGSEFPKHKRQRNVFSPRRL